MRYINTLHEGETIRNVYLCKGKRSAETRNGRPYDNLILQDKTGTLDGKVWDPNSGGIADYDEMDFIEVYGDIISYNNNLQLNIKQIRKARQGRIYRGVVYDTSTIERILVSIVVRDKNAEKTVQAIIKAAQTGEIGDGRIFVIPIEDAIRIRTAERGDIALYNAEQER